MENSGKIARLEELAKEKDELMRLALQAARERDAAMEKLREELFQPNGGRDDP